MIERITGILDNLKMKYLVMVFFIMQPLIDMYRTYFQGKFNICGFAVEELINILFVGILLGLTIYNYIKKDKKDKKSFIKYILYLMLLCVYMLFHCVNITKFDTQIYGEANINFITEIYYTIRTYVIPIVLIFIMYHVYFTDKDFSKIIIIITLIISGSIVITNLFNISLVAYSEENVRIEGNIFKWLTLNSESNFAAYTSRGFFYSTNQISALMFSLLPIIVKEAIKHNKIRYYLILIIQVLSMIMIGTKTAAIGCLLVLIAMVAVTLFLSFMKLEKNINLKICIPVLLVVIMGAYCLYMISPSKLKFTLEKKEQQDIRQDAELTVDETKDDDGNSGLEGYVKKFAYNYYIQDWFLEIYPVHNDEQFWSTIISRDKTLNMDNRKFKIDIIKRIIDRNENKLDSLFGIGYTSNVPYTERDYVYQYYIYGSIGLFILIGPYIAILCYCIYTILRKYKEKLNLENCAIGLSLCSMLFAGYLSGHVWGMIINMYFMSLYAGVLLYNARKEGEKIN